MPQLEVLLYVGPQQIGFEVYLPVVLIQRRYKYCYDVFVFSLRLSQSPKELFVQKCTNVIHFKFQRLNEQLRRKAEVVLE